MAASSSTGHAEEDVYPHDVQQLLLEHSKYPIARKIYFAASNWNITEQNRRDFEIELDSIEKLYPKLNLMRNASFVAIKTLTGSEMSLCRELLYKVPNIQRMPQFAELSRNQRLSISHALEAKRQEKVVASYGPQDEVLKALLACYTPLELSQILQVRLDLTKELTANFPTSRNPSEHAILLKKLPATMDPREPSQIIDDILGKLKGISPQIEEHHARARSCGELVRSLRYFIDTLRLWLGILKKERKEKRQMNAKASIRLQNRGTRSSEM